jgi:hypothetical protein
MDESQPRSLQGLREAMKLAASIADPAERALEVVAIIAAAALPLGVTPVIVGGMAVYFWTADDAFLTSDIDVIMETPPQVRSLLEALGFAPLQDLRHWQLEDTDVLLEAPAATLDAGATVTEVKLRSGRSGNVISRIDILLDRLDEFQATGHRIVAQQVLVLLAQMTAEDSGDLLRRARQRRLTKVLESMAVLASDVAAGQDLPETDELHAVARSALQAEYTPEGK